MMWDYPVDQSEGAVHPYRGTAESLVGEGGLVYYPFSRQKVGLGLEGKWMAVVVEVL